MNVSVIPKFLKIQEGELTVTVPLPPQGVPARKVCQLQVEVARFERKLRSMGVTQ